MENQSEPQNQKILFISNVDWFFLSHRLPLAEKAQKLGAEVLVAAQSTGKLEAFKKSGIPFTPLNFRRSSFNIIALFKLILEISRLISSQRPTIVHAITTKMIVIVGAACLFTKKYQLIFTVSGLGNLYEPKNLKTKLAMVLFKKTVKIFNKKLKPKWIFQNSTDCHTILGDSGAETYFLPGSGVDIDVFKKLVRGFPATTTFLFAARLINSKGLADFVAAAQNLHNENFRFLVAGAPDLDNFDVIPNQQIERWKEIPNIEFLGHVENLQNVFEMCTVLVVPTRYGEGLPKIICEASAAKRATIAYSVPGCKAAIDHEITGLLVPVGDVEELAKAMLLLGQDKQKAKNMGERAYQKALDLFNLSNIVDKHMRIYGLISTHNEQKVEEKC